MTIQDEEYKALKPHERLSVFITDIKGVKTSFLSERTGMPQGTINLILRGQRKVSIDEMQDICRALNEPSTTFID